MGRRDLKVAVGVDGSRTSMAAARWAASVVHRRGGSLVIARGYVPQSLYLLTGGQALASLRDSEHQLVSDVAEGIRSEFTGLAVETLVESVALGPLLMNLAENVDGLVIGRQKASWVERATLGDISSDISVRARCPVVTVPLGTEGSRGPVVVPFDWDAPVERVLRVAFTWARDSGQELVLLHSVPECISTDDVKRFYDRALSAVSSWIAAYPACRARVQLVNGERERVFVDAVPNASLMVVDRPRRAGRPLAAWRFCVSRVDLQRAACPVLVVDRD